MLREIEMEKASDTMTGLPKSLLVVGDNEAVQKVLSRILPLTEHKVNRANDVLEAATVVLTGSCDLVISDFQMAVKNSCGLSRLVKEKPPDTPFVVITSFTDDEQWEKLNTNYIDAIIMKPVTEEVEKTVQRLLNS
jgi:CheY-like chemotaxis protein